MLVSGRVYFSNLGVPQTPKASNLYWVPLACMSRPSVYSSWAWLRKREKGRRSCSFVSCCFIWFRWGGNIQAFLNYPDSQHILRHSTSKFNVQTLLSPCLHHACMSQSNSMPSTVHRLNLECLLAPSTGVIPKRRKPSAQFKAKPLTGNVLEEQPVER